MFFLDLAEWSLDDLSSLVKIPPSVLRRRMAFWQSHGILVESQPGIFKLIEEDLPKSHLEKLPINEIIAEDDDNESAMASASDQREEELQVRFYILQFTKQNYLLLTCDFCLLMNC